MKINVLGPSPSDQILEQVTALIEKQRDEILERHKKLPPTNMQRALVKAVPGQLLEFCRQCPEFAQKILDDPKKDLTGCLKACDKQTDRDRSDDAVYLCAAQYYAPGCAVRNVRTLILDPAKEKPKAQTVNILDWL